MTNFEFYKEKILNYIADCYETDCTPFAFIKAVGKKFEIDCAVGHCKECMQNALEWLYAEHIEPLKLTKRERAFCEVAQTGWISRDYNGNLTWRNNKPEKVFSTNDKYWGGTGDAVWLDPLFKKDDFWFIWWSDEKPWSVEDLLKLEVMEVQEDA